MGGKGGVGSMLRAIGTRVEKTTKRDTEKLDYLLKKACHKPELVEKTNCLAYSCKHIVMRHEFLIRAGFFKPILYHKLHKQSFVVQPLLPREKYYPPADIICTSDTGFLKKCTQNLLTLNELAAFEEIFEVEYKKMNSDQIDDDDDAESDEGEYADSPKSRKASSSSDYFNEKDSAEFYY